MILNFILAHPLEKINPAFSDSALVLRWVFIEPIPGGFIYILAGPLLDEFLGKP
jgi:hypothetical protein